MKGLGRFLPSRPVPAAEHRSMGSFQVQFNTSDVRGSGEGYDFAWQIPSAWRASTLLAGLIGTLPLEGYRELGDGTARQITPTPMMLSAPTPMRTYVEVMRAWVLDYLFHGNAVGLVASRDASTGEPTSFIPVPAPWVMVTVPEHMSNFDLAVLGGAVRYRIGAQEFGPWDVLHVRGPARPGALRGVGVLEAALSTFTLANDQRTQAGNVGRHGVPSGTLYADDTDVTPEEMKEGRADFMRSQQNGRTVAALPPGVKFQALSWNPEELQLLEARKMSDADMALLFGLPASFLNVEAGSLTYSNVGQDGLNLLKFTVNLITTAFEEEFSRLMAPGECAKFNREAVLETDALTRAQFYATGIQAGWLLKSEARAEEGLPAVAGIDDKPDPASFFPPKPATEEDTDAPDAQEGEDK